MTRPLIYYSTNVSQSTVYSWYDFSGKLLFSGPTGSPVVTENRRVYKPASISTVSRRGGQFTTPTAYRMQYGHFTCHGQATEYTSDTRPGFQYRCEIPVAYYSGIGYDPLNLYTVPSWVENALLIKALNKLRSSDVNFGVMLAEAGETAELFTTTAHRIASAVNAFRIKRPGDFLKAAVHQGTASWRKTPQAWLELQYGWNPLMSDLYGACSELDSPKTREKNVFSVKSKKTLMDALTVDFSSVLYSGCRVTVGVKADMKVSLAYRLRNFTLALLSSLGLTNPAEIVWERVPFSFVVDWFLPVGNWLSALGGDFGYDFLNGCYSRFCRFQNVSTDVVLSGLMTKAYVPSIEGGGVSFERSVYSSSPWPGLYLKSPVSSVHIANASSLLAQAFRRPRR